MEQLKIESLSGSDERSRILKLIGPFTLSGVFDFQAISREQAYPVTIIDLSKVPFMDSAALGSILGFRASCQREARQCAMAGVSPRIRTLFQVAGVDSLLVSYASVQDAESALLKGASA
jgi:anti-sigma B factor antagonist